MVSSRLSSAGETAAIMSVEAFPPSDSRSRSVSFESRYGMCFDLESASILMTRPSIMSDLLMAAPSDSRSPVAPVRACATRTRGVRLLARVSSAREKRGGGGEEHTHLPL